MKINRNYVFITIVSMITSQVFSQSPIEARYNPYSHKELILSSSSVPTPKPKPTQNNQVSKPKPKPTLIASMPVVSNQERYVPKQNIPMPVINPIDEPLVLPSDAELRREVAEALKDNTIYEIPKDGVLGKLGFKRPMTADEVDKKIDENSKWNEKLHDYKLRLNLSEYK